MVTDLGVCMCVYLCVCVCGCVSVAVFQPRRVASQAPPLAHDLTAGLAGCGALVLSDYAKGALAHPVALISVARQQGVPVIVDPKGKDFERYRGATVITPNLAELEAIVGPLASESALEDAGHVDQV